MSIKVLDHDQDTCQKKAFFFSIIYTVSAKSIRTKKFFIKKVLFVENKHLAILYNEYILF